MRTLRRILTLTFALCGILFLIPSLAISVHLHRAEATMLPVSGEITDFASKNPIVRYTVDGIEYQARGSVSSSSQRVGDAYPLLVDPDDPARTTDPGLRVLVWTFAIIGGVMLATAAVICGVMRASERRTEALRAYGRRVPATVTSVRENRSISMGRRHPMVVEAQCAHPITREAVRLRATVWKTALQPGDAVDALFDPMDEKKYALDLVEEGAEGGAVISGGR